MKFPLSLSISMARHLARMKRDGVERFPLVLMLEPLHTCNLSCAGCGRIIEYSMTMDSKLDLDQCIEAAVSAMTPVVSICGGEPLLHPDICSIISGMLSMRRQVYLCTNGLLLQEFVEKLEPDPLLWINVHIDGMRDTHDSLCGRAGVFDTAIAGLMKARARGLRTCTNTTVYNSTSPSEILELLQFLDSLGIDGMLLSPGFDFHASPSEGGSGSGKGNGNGNGKTSKSGQSITMNRAQVREKFRVIAGRAGKLRILSSPLYMDFLTGKKDYQCAPWGTVTKNPSGWRSPCYLIADSHERDFDGLMKNTPWEHYGPGRDKRCENCMMHSGFETAAVLGRDLTFKDAMRIAWWSFR